MAELLFAVKGEITKVGTKTFGQTTKFVDDFDMAECFPAEENVNNWEKMAQKLNWILWSNFCFPFS